MATVITQAMAGAQCTFRSKSPNETQVLQGTIAGIDIAYRAASQFRSIPQYNNAVRAADQTVNSDPSQLTYFLLSIPNADPTLEPSLTAFAQEWISDGSFSIVTQDTPVSLTVYVSPTTTAQNVIDFLWEGGYRAYQNTTS